MHLSQKSLSSLQWIGAALILCVVGLYFRFYPLCHNVASDAYEKSTLIVISQLRQMIAQQVEQDSPSMPDAIKQSLIQTRLNQTLKENKDRVQKMFHDLGLKILKDNPQNDFYLQESDSYYFLDLTKTILETGKAGSQIKGNQFFHEKMIAPQGQWEPHLWHSYLGAWIYRGIHFFKPDVDLMLAVAWTPIIIFPLVVFAFLFTTKSLGIAPFPSLIAGIFFVLAHIFLKRSTFAWYDNDIYTILFPILSLGCLFQSFLHSSSLKKASLWIFLSSLSMILYAQFWPGWIFLWILLSLSLLTIGLKNGIEKTFSIEKNLFPFLMIVFLPLFSLLFFLSPQQIVEIFTHAIVNLKNFIQPKINAWPDLYILVGELKRASFSDIVDLNGGWIIVGGAILGAIYGLWQVIKKKTLFSSHIITLVVYLLGTLYLAISAQRFAMLTIVPLAILLAFAFHHLFIFSRSIFEQYIPRAWALFILIVSFALVSFFPIHHAQKNIRSFITPIFNATWDEVLTKIREETPSNTIVHAWWSPGHFIKAIANRRVTFDGASIRGDIAFWLNQVYLSQTEKEALSLLRMLSTSSNESSLFLEQKGWPLSKVVPLIKGLIVLEPQQALAILKKILPEKEALHLLSLTHGKKGELPPSQILLYNEQMEGHVLLGYLGKWNFHRVEDLNTSPALLKSIPKKADKSFIDFLWSLSGGPYRQSSKLNLITQNDSLLVFDQGVSLNLSSMEANINSPQFGNGIPLSVFYFDSQTQQVVEKKSQTPSLGYSVVYIDAPEAKSVFLMDRDVASSLIVKLYYFDGKGLKNFQLFTKAKDLTGRTKIMSFSVLWPENF